MIDIAKLKIGDKVYYQPSHYGNEKWENGMVKEIPDHTNDSVRVVYNCGGDWNNFQNYTSALTNIRDLKLGWKHEDGKEDCNHEFEEDSYKYSSRLRMKCVHCGKVINE